MAEPRRGREDEDVGRAHPLQDGGPLVPTAHVCLDPRTHVEIDHAHRITNRPASRKLLEDLPGHDLAARGRRRGLQCAYQGDRFQMPRHRRLLERSGGRWSSRRFGRPGCCSRGTRRALTGSHRTDGIGSVEGPGHRAAPERACTQAFAPPDRTACRSPRRSGSGPLRGNQWSRRRGSCPVAIAVTRSVCMPEPDGRAGALERSSSPAAPAAR